MMKHTTKILLLTLVFSISAKAFGQFSRTGIKAGLNMSNLTVEGNDDNNLKFGLHAGVFTKVNFTESFALQPELLYSSKGSKHNYDESLIADGETKFNLNYLELPVKLVYYLAEDFNFQFGPYIGYLINANADTDAEVLDFFDIDSEDEIDRDRFNAFDFGFTGGLGFELDPLVLGFNYNLGLIQVAKNDNLSEEILGDARNTVIQVYAGILF